MVTVKFLVYNYNSIHRGWTKEQVDGNDAWVCVCFLGNDDVLTIMNAYGWLKNNMWMICWWSWL